MCDKMRSGKAASGELTFSLVLAGTAVSAEPVQKGSVARSQVNPGPGIVR